MDGRDFDNLLRSLTGSRRTILGGSLAALGGLLGISQVEAKKKKKKKCAKKCPDGCCTKKYGKCIQPAQQSSTQCGSGGEICRTNCGGVPTCSGCEGCCDGTTCIELGGHDENHCGHGGVACFPCDDNQRCAGPFCCGKQGHTCSGGDTDCCIGWICDAGKCCTPNAFECTKDSDCCQPLDSACEDGQCVFKHGASCTPGSLCESPLTCDSQTLTCGGDTDCATACAQDEHCEFLNCGGNLLCCDLGPCTSPPGERCNCLEGPHGCTGLN